MGLYTHQDTNKPDIAPAKVKLKKNKTFSCRIDELTTERIAHIAKYLKVSKSDLLITLVNKEWAGYLRALEFDARPPISDELDAELGHIANPGENASTPDTGA